MSAQLRTARENIRLSAASSRLIVAFAAPVSCRAATYARISVVLILISRLPLKGGSRARSIRRLTWSHDLFPLIR